MTTEITEGVKVSVESKYQPEYSNPANKLFMFSYEVYIKNLSAHSVQLMSRQWQIFDSDGTHRIVAGEGVVGLQPIIKPGEYHEYVSACNLQTDIGSMVGFYEMKRLVGGEYFRVGIPRFSLISSFRLN